MQREPTEPQERVSVLAGIVQAANPVFIIIVICLPTAAVVYAINWGSLGLQLVGRLGYPLDSPRIIAALVITGILTLQGFGVLLPNEFSMFRQLLSPRPDVNKISRIGMRNATLGGIQGIFQLAIIFDMAVLRF